MNFPTPVFDANAAGGSAFGNLPEWDLTDLYTSENAPELARDMKPNAPHLRRVMRASLPRLTRAACWTPCNAMNRSM